MSKPARRDFLRWARLGSALALILDVLLLANGHLSLWQPGGLLGGFFDAQARAMLRGTLAVPPAAVSFEGFRVGGQTFMYFGIVPALLRIPVLLVTHRLDGRLTQLSMLLAVLVTAEAAARLHWHVRERVRPAAAVASGERGLVALLSLAIGAGLPLYLVSWPSVYHEAALWGLALSLAALSATLAAIDERSPRRILVAAGLGALAVNTRISVGLAPVLTLVLLGAAWIVAARRGRRGRRARGPQAAAVASERSRRGCSPSAARRSPWSRRSPSTCRASARPWACRCTTTSPTGSIRSSMPPCSPTTAPCSGCSTCPRRCSARSAPTPSLITHTFPFLGLPAHAGPVIGSALFVARLPSLSLVTALPVLVVLTLAGLPRIAATARARPLALGLLGSAAAFATTLTVSSVATRYLGDAVPLLALGACAGLQSILAREPGGRTWMAAVAGIGLLTGLGVLIDGAAGVTEQRLLAPTTQPAERAAFIATQLDVADGLGLRPPTAAAGAMLPTTAPGAPGDLFVLGRCAGLYVTSATGTWLAAERGRDGGLIRVDARLPDARAPARPLVVVGSGRDRLTFAVIGSRTGPRLTVSGRGRVLASGAPLARRGARRVSITISFDPLGAGEYVSASVAGRLGLASTRVAYRPGEPVSGGSAADGVRLLADQVGVCRRLSRADHLP